MYLPGFGAPADVVHALAARAEALGFPGWTTAATTKSERDTDEAIRAHVAGKVALVASDCREIASDEQRPWLRHLSDMANNADIASRVDTLQHARTALIYHAKEEHVPVYVQRRCGCGWSWLGWIGEPCPRCEQTSRPKPHESDLPPATSGHAGRWVNARWSTVTLHRFQARRRVDGDVDIRELRAAAIFGDGGTAYGAIDCWTTPDPRGVRGWQPVQRMSAAYWRAEGWVG